ncbi:unnamed protein product [Paramecium sonneborni]|uniref:Uncharacterized protein n=1 Tax=Paramecium sonneborni TaxID=65129 RepID=A0A8S1Q1U2_9CILI|nr:unnamed protein product [Paramecium sonneborni]
MPESFSDLIIQQLIKKLKNSQQKQNENTLLLKFQMSNKKNERKNKKLLSIQNI